MADARGFGCSVLTEDLSQYNERHGYLSVIKSGHKIKFKWLGEFGELKVFVSTDLKISGTWSYTTNNGGFHTLKAEGISISFYPGTKTLNVQGSKSEIISKKLLDIANTIAEKYDSTPDTDLTSEKFFETNSEHEQQDNDNEEGNATEIADAISGDLDEKDHSGCAKKIAVAIHELSDKFCYEISILRSQIFELRNTTTPSKTSEGNSLQMENKNLKQRLEDLGKRHDALRLEAKALQDENKSLITALRLLNGEIEKENKSSNLHADESLEDPVQQDSEWNQVTSKKRKRQGKKNQNNDSDNNVKSSSHTTNPSEKKSVVILGDSMTHNIQGRKLSKEKYVVSKSFSGSTVEDMSDFVKPFLRRSPDEIILHIGTNNLSTDEPKQLGEKIVNLARFIERESPLSKLAVSSLIVRKDDLDRKVKTVNKTLRSFCNSNGWTFISNENIDASCINKGGLHLNRKGVYKLAGNFRNHINSD